MINTSFISTLDDYETEIINGITVHYFDHLAEFELKENIIQVGFERNGNGHYFVRNKNPYLFFTIFQYVGPDFFSREDMKAFCRDMIGRSKMILACIKFESEQRKKHWKTDVIN